MNFTIYAVEYFPKFSCCNDKHLGFNFLKFIFFGSKVNPKMLVYPSNLHPSVLLQDIFITKKV